METVMNITSEFNTALNEFSRCIDFVGVHKTLVALRNLRYRETNIKDDTVRFVLETATNQVGISIDELLTSRNWSLDRRICMGICTYLFSFYFDYSAREIALIMKKDKSTCWRNMAMLKNLSIKNNDEKRLLAAFRATESNVILYLNSK